MGYLDDLKKQAQGIRQEQLDPSLQEHQQAAVQRALQLSLRLIYGYLAELTEHLNLVRPDITVRYDIEGYGTIADLRQGDYVLQVDDPRLIGDLALSFACAATESHARAIRTADRSAFLRQRDYLWRHGLKFDSKLAVSGEGTLLIEPVVPVTLRFVPDVKTRRIRFVIHNLDRLGEESYLIDPLRLNRQHLDGIAGLVLRKPDSLQQLTGPLITDHAKTRIRKALAEERKRQLRHEAKAAAISLAEQKAATERRLSARLRRASRTAVDDLADALVALGKWLRPYALSAHRWSLSTLRRLIAKLSAGIQSHLSRR